MRPYPASYIAYLVQFHATRDYFECHELLEDYWKEHPHDGLDALWVGLIQLAVGQYHERRGNRRGARLMYSQSLLRLEISDLAAAGLAGDDLLRQLRERLAAAAENSDEQPYRDIHIGIVDRTLMALCDEQCRGLGVEWGSPSPMDNDSIIHRHKLRDRSDVISAREAAIQAREAGKRR